MPAYRSEAEAEVRAAAVERLREIVPGCRIIHEINACSFGNRIDVLAVGENRLAAVEVKSEKDKLDRLPKQIMAMRGVSNLVFTALHEKFLSFNEKLGWYCVPDEARHSVVWTFPRVERKGHVGAGAEWLERDRWEKQFSCLPEDAIRILWRSELHAMCRSIGVRGASKLTMPEAVDVIRWNWTGAKISRAICAALRARECVEADPPITTPEEGE